MRAERLVIGISGTPGTGKTTIAKILKDKLSAILLNLTEIALENDFLLEYDADRNTGIANFDKLIPFIQQTIESHSENIIIEGHYADIIPDDLLSLLIILRTKPQVLKQRLVGKQFPPQKVLENIQSEILGSCTSSALENHTRAKLIEIDTSDEPPERSTEQILRLIKTRPPSNVGQINWMQQLEQGTLLKYFP